MVDDVMKTGIYRNGKRYFFMILLHYRFFYSASIKENQGPKNKNCSIFQLVIFFSDLSLMMLEFKRVRCQGWLLPRLRSLSEPNAILLLKSGEQLYLIPDLSNNATLLKFIPNFLYGITLPLKFFNILNLLNHSW